MTPSLTDALCTSCGLCCDGSLFADVELTGEREATGLELLGLGIEDDGAGGSVLMLPCAALCGTRCTIYPHRPKTCRTFECGLLQGARRGAVTVARAQSHIAAAHRAIARVNRLIAALGGDASHLPLAERCAETLARHARATPALRRTCAELEAAMATVQTLIRTVFMDEGVRRPGTRRS